MHPNTFIVGFQRCGSSSLFNHLCRHPQVSGSNPKETYFLADRSYENFDQNLNISNPASKWDDFYKDIDPDSANRSPMIFLEASVCNFYQETAKQYIGSLDHAKVIFIVRDPIERLISNFKYYLGNIPKLDDTINFDQYITMVKEGAFSEDSLKYALVHGEYSTYLKEWEAIVGAEHIMTVSLNQLIDDSDSVTRRLTRFLGIEPLQLGEFPLQNRSKRPLWPGLHKVLMKFARKDLPYKDQLKSLYYKLLAGERQYELSQSTEKELRAYYSNEYKELSEYF